VKAVAIDGPVDRPSSGARESTPADAEEARP